MRLLLDLGNTRLKAALHDGARLAPVVAFAHADAGFQQQFDAWLAAQPMPAQCWLASVAPAAVLVRVMDVLARQRLAPRVVRVQPDAFGLRLAYAEPQRLGVDRWLAMLAARAAGERNAVLVANVGSALTIDAVDRDGRHLGGLIAPPPDALRAALLARAPRLDFAAGQVQRFAANSEDAVASGCLLPAAALIERSLQELAQHGDSAPRLVLGGGGAAPLRPWLPAHRHEPELVLAGLALRMQAD